VFDGRFVASAAGLAAPTASARDGVQKAHHQRRVLQSGGAMRSPRTQGRQSRRRRVVVADPREVPGGRRARRFAPSGGRFMNPMQASSSAPGSDCNLIAATTRHPEAWLEAELGDAPASSSPIQKTPSNRSPRWPEEGSAGLRQKNDVYCALRGEYPAIDPAAATPNRFASDLHQSRPIWKIRRRDTIQEAFLSIMKTRPPATTLARAPFFRSGRAADPTNTLASWQPRRGRGRRCRWAQYKDEAQNRRRARPSGRVFPRDDAYS